jgi:hypothetical protein
MIELLEKLPQQQRLLVLQNQGLIRAYHLAKRYHRMVRELTLSSGKSPVPALLPVESNRQQARSQSRRPFGFSA